MRTAAKTDNNQQAIVATFRAAGASVMVLSAVGHGCPDLLGIAAVTNKKENHV